MIEKMQKSHILMVVALVLVVGSVGFWYYAITQIPKTWCAKTDELTLKESMGDFVLTHTVRGITVKLNYVDKVTSGTLTYVRGSNVTFIYLASTRFQPVLLNVADSVTFYYSSLLTHADMGVFVTNTNSTSTLANICPF